MDPFKILRIISFLDLLAAGMLAPITPYRANILGNNQIQIGVMGSLYWVFQLLAIPIAIKLCDEIKKRKYLAMFLFFACAMAYLILGVTTNNIIFIAVKSLTGLFNHTQLLTKAFVQDYESDKIQQSIKNDKLVLSSIVGMCLGCAVGVNILEVYPDLGFTITSTVAAILLVINSYLLTKLSKRTEMEVNKTNKNANEKMTPSYLLDAIKRNIKESVDDVRKIDKSIRSKEIVCHSLITMALGIYTCNQVLFFKTKHHAPIPYLGYLVSFQTAVGFLGINYSNEISGFLKDRKDLTERHLLVFFSFTICLIGIVISSDFMIYLIFLVLFTIFSALCRVTAFELVLANSTEKKSVVGVSSGFRSVVNIVAPLIAGFVGHFAGILAVIYVPLILTFISLILSYKIRLQTVSLKSKAN